MTTRLILGVVGAAIGAPFGMASLGWSLGSAIGGAMETPDPKTVEGPRITDLKVQTSTYGNTIPKLFGTNRVAGNVIWMTDVIEHRHETTQEQGGKGGGQEVTTVSYTYTVSVAVSLGQGVISGIKRIWAGGEVIYQNDSVVGILNGPAFVAYPGDETQLPDPTIEAYLGVGNVPAYRGQGYVVLPDFDITKYGARIPNLMFEVVATGGAVVPYMILTAVSPPTGVVWTGEGTLSAGMSVQTTDVAYPDGSRTHRSNIYKQLMFPDGSFSGKGYCNSIVIRTTSGSASSGFYYCKSDPSITLVVSGHSGFFWFYLSIGGQQSKPMVTSFSGGSSTLVQAYGSLFLHTQTGVSYRFDANQRSVRKLSSFAILPSTTIFSLCVGVDGNLYGDTGGTVVRLDRNFGVLATWTKVGFSGSWLVFAVDGDAFYFQALSGGVQVLVLRTVQVAGTITGGGQSYVFPHLSVNFVSQLVYLGKGLVALPPYGIATLSPTVSEGTISLASVVSLLCAEVGLDAGDIDTSALVGNALGYTVANRMSCRSALQPLLDAYQIEVCESNGKVKFLHRGAAPVVTISSRDIIQESS